MSKTVDWFKRAGEIMTVLGVFGGLFAGIITLFGGQLPPWFTPREAASMQQQLTKVASAFDDLTKQIDKKECLDYKDRLDRALAKLSMAPTDLTAQLLARSARERIGQIQGCDP